MKKLLLIDPIYNPGNIPPSISLGKIEAIFARTDIHMELSDFVMPDWIFRDLDHFCSYEDEFIHQTVRKGADADVVYISAEHGNEMKPYPTFPRVRRLAAGIKAANPSAKIIVGGALVNLFLTVYRFPQDTLSESVDLFVAGQSLRAIAPLSEALGITAPPLSASTEWALWDFAKYPDYVSIQLRTGCAYKCDFCFEGRIYDKANINDSLENIQATLCSVKRRHGIDRFLLEDSVVLSYPDYADVVDALGASGVTFAAYARISEICRWPDRLALLQQAGATCVIVGIETLDDGILQSTKKNILAKQTREALDTARSMQMGVQGCFMLGFPAGGLCDSRRTIDFAIEQDLNCYRWHVFMPDYTNLDAAFRIPDGFDPLDVLRVQLDVPDRFLFQSLADGPTIGLLDEHSLVRSLNHVDLETPLLHQIAYEGNFTYAQLIALMKERIGPVNLPLNEDEMYERLFPASVPDSVSDVDTGQQLSAPAASATKIQAGEV